MPYPEKARWVPYYLDDEMKKLGLISYYICSGCKAWIRPGEIATVCPMCGRQMAHKIVFE